VPRKLGLITHHVKSDTLMRDDIAQEIKRTLGMVRVLTDKTPHMVCFPGSNHEGKSMAPPRLGSDGLTHKQRRFAALIAKGMTKTDAFLIAFGRGRKSQDGVYQAACVMSKKPKVLARVQELLEVADISDIDSVQAAMADLLSDIELARERGHMSALAALTDKRLRCHGMLSDRLVLSAEQRASDTDLIEALARGNEATRDTLRLTLASKDGFDS